jgi:hypothetical protein
MRAMSGDRKLDPSMSPTPHVLELEREQNEKGGGWGLSQGYYIPRSESGPRICGEVAYEKSLFRAGCR